jgi:hypothetical protein
MANQYQQLRIMVTDNGRVRITDGTGPLGTDMPLAGARAEIGDIQDHSRDIGVHTLIPFIGLIHAPMTATVIVTFANGVVHRRQITGKRLVREARQEVIQFNQQVMAAGQGIEEGTPVAAEPDSQSGAGVAAELERLTTLHESGALDDEEFRAAKARIIHGG